MANVNLDVWNATDTGCYESFEGCPAPAGHPEQYRLRGKMTTDAEGRYSFETILPGAYLNGSKYRPRHIHIIIITLTKSNPALWDGTWNRMIFQLPPNTSKQPVEARIYNGLGVLIRRTLETTPPIGLDMAGLSPGTYVVEFMWWTRNGQRKESIPMRI